MMRNVSAKAFRGTFLLSPVAISLTRHTVHASSKKFMACLEILLLAPPMRPYISAATCRTMTDILADLTYMYGTETGCEGLLELWRKVKKPQQPDHVSHTRLRSSSFIQGVPLPEDHQIYVPQPTYANGFSSYASEPPSLAGSRRPSPPSLQNVPLDDRSFLPPMPLPMPSPRHFGPGYAQLPDHGEDMRRLGNECIAAKESARVLSEALVFTRPDELESKPIIGVNITSRRTSL